MSVVKTRTGYLPTSGSAALSPAYDSHWTNTSLATRIGGVWDSHSGSANVQTTLSGTAPTLPIIDVATLLYQHVFPAFGAGMDFSTPPSGPGVFFNGSPIALVQNTLGSFSWATVDLHIVTKICDHTGAFKGYLTAVPGIGNTGSSVSTSALKGCIFGAGSYVISFLPLATDILVVETGLAAYHTSLSPRTFKYNFQFGDLQTNLDIIGSPTANSSGFVIAWWGSLSPASGGWGFNHPLSPLMTPKRVLPFTSPANPIGLNQFRLNGSRLN